MWKNLGLMTYVDIALEKNAKIAKRGRHITKSEFVNALLFDELLMIKCIILIFKLKLPLL